MTPPMTPPYTGGIAPTLSSSDHDDYPPVARDESALRKEVVARYARLCSGDSNEAEQLDLQDWLQQHPDHRRAWERMQSIRQTMQTVPSNIALPTLQSVRRSRRNVLRGMFLLASSGGLAYVSYRSGAGQTVLQPWLADYRTVVGEQRSVLLNDGSRLVLNTDSAVDVHYTETHRKLRLWSGEILIETAKHRQAAEDVRPFVVLTNQGSVRALGTRFTVRSFDTHSLVSVLDDAVELRTRDTGHVRILQAGESAVLTATDIGLSYVSDADVAQWEQGSLVVNDRSLGEVIAELARYRRGRLSCDPAVAGIRVSGAFPLDNTDHALQVLVKSFPLRMSSVTRYWVTLGPI